MAAFLLHERTLLILLLTGLLFSPIPALAEEPFNCGDGPRYKIDVKEFQIKYSGESLKANLGFLSNLKVGLEAEAKTLQKAAESTQNWNQLLVGLAVSYNSCAIPKKQFQEALSTLYPGLQSDAKKMADMGKTLKEGRQADLKDFKRLLDQYFQKLERFAQISGKEEIIRTISDKIEEEHEETRRLIEPIEPKLDQVLAELKMSKEKDRLIANLIQQLQETRGELEKKGASEALSQFKQGNFQEAEELFKKEHMEGKAKQARAAYYLGNIKFAELEFFAAMEYYTEAARLERNNPEYKATKAAMALIVDVTTAVRLSDFSMKIVAYYQLQNLFVPEDFDTQQFFALLKKIYPNQFPVKFIQNNYQVSVRSLNGGYSVMLCDPETNQKIMEDLSCHLDRVEIRSWESTTSSRCVFENNPVASK